jgi:hypothetical protein
LAIIEGNPAISVGAPDGREAHHYIGADLMDRPGDAEVLAALDRLALPPIDVPRDPVAHRSHAPAPRAIKLPALTAYMRGV